MLNQADQSIKFGLFSNLDPPLSAMRLESHREGQHDLTDSSLVSIRFLFPEGSVFIPQMTLAVGKNWFHSILRLILCIIFHGVGLLARFVAYNLHFLFYLSFRSLNVYHNFYCTFFLLSSIDIAWSQVFLYVSIALVILT
jgi:hypothetical protein